MDQYSYIGNYLVIPRGITDSDYIISLDDLDENGNRKINHISLNTNKLYTKNHKFLIKLDVASSTIERLISSCGDNIKQSIAKVYNSISDLHYDVDSLVTGYDKNKRKINIDLAKSSADLTIDRITKDITNLRGNF
jgi:hypothetical protein